MNKFNLFFDTHGSKLILALLILVYFKSCGIDGELEKTKKDVRALTAEVDTLQSNLERDVITQPQMEEIISETIAWGTLRIEEISDKERISINALQQREDAYKIKQ